MPSVLAKHAKGTREPGPAPWKMVWLFWKLVSGIFRTCLKTADDCRCDSTSGSWDKLFIAAYWGITDGWGPRPLRTPDGTPILCQNARQDMRGCKEATAGDCRWLRASGAAETCLSVSIVTRSINSWRSKKPQSIFYENLYPGNVLACGKVSIWCLNSYKPGNDLD
jgi:hypothetical protein